MDFRTHHKHFYVKFGDPSCIVFEISCGKTDTQTNGGENLPLQLPAAWVTKSQPNKTTLGMRDSVVSKTS